MHDRQQAPQAAEWAMIAILAGAVFIGLVAGMPFTAIVDSVNEGIGNTLNIPEPFGPS